MGDKVEENENESRKGEVNEKETKSKRYMLIEHIYCIIIYSNCLVLRINGTLL
jgi:hypothetical protein